MRTAGKRLDQLKKKRDWSRTASLHSVVASSRPLIFFCTVFQHDGFFKSEGGLFFGSRCLLLYKLIASLPPGGPACPQGRGTHSAASKRRLKRPCAKMGQCPLCCAAVKVSIFKFQRHAFEIDDVYTALPIFPARHFGRGARRRIDWCLWSWLTSRIFKSRLTLSITL